MTSQQDAAPQSTVSPQAKADKPAPDFPVGVEVEVIVNDRNRTYHRGVIALCDLAPRRQNLALSIDLQRQKDQQALRSLRSTCCALT